MNWMSSTSKRRKSRPVRLVRSSSSTEDQVDEGYGEHHETRSHKERPDSTRSFDVRRFLHRSPKAPVRQWTQSRHDERHCSPQRKDYGRFAFRQKPGCIPPDLEFEPTHSKTGAQHGRFDEESEEAVESEHDTSEEDYLGQFPRRREDSDLIFDDMPFSSCEDDNFLFNTPELVPPRARSRQRKGIRHKQQSEKRSRSGRFWAGDPASNEIEVETISNAANALNDESELWNTFSLAREASDDVRSRNANEAFQTKRRKLQQTKRNLPLRFEDDPFSFETSFKQYRSHKFVRAATPARKKRSRAQILEKVDEDLHLFDFDPSPPPPPQRRHERPTKRRKHPLRTEEPLLALPSESVEPPEMSLQRLASYPFRLLRRDTHDTEDRLKKSQRLISQLQSSRECDRETISVLQQQIEELRRTQNILLSQKQQERQNVSVPARNPEYADSIYLNIKASNLNLVGAEIDPRFKCKRVRLPQSVQFEEVDDDEADSFEHNQNRSARNAATHRYVRTSSPHVVENFATVLQDIEGADYSETTRSPSDREEHSPYHKSLKFSGQAVKTSTTSRTVHRRN